MSGASTSYKALTNITQVNRNDIKPASYQVQKGNINVKKTISSGGAPTQSQALPRRPQSSGPLTDGQNGPSHNDF